MNGESLASTRLWHGGAPGRKIGERLLPPSVTGLQVTRLRLSLLQGATAISQRHDRVYVTSDRELARAWAGIWTPDGIEHGGGSLYAVVPDLPIDPDSDLLSLPGLSYQVPSATVTAVYDPCVLYNDKWRRKLDRVLKELESRRRNPAHS